MFDDVCGVCESSRWWVSKHHYLVCAICTPDPLQALVILARRGSVGAIRRAESWAQEVHEVKHS
jgi:hypothetical protein